MHLRAAVPLTSLTFTSNTPPAFGADVFLLIVNPLVITVPFGSNADYEAALFGLLPPDSKIVNPPPVIITPIIPPIIIITPNPIVGAITATPVAGSMELYAKPARDNVTYAYQWQEKDLNGSWQDIPHATTNPYLYKPQVVTKSMTSHVVRLKVSDYQTLEYTPEITFTLEDIVLTPTPTKPTLSPTPAKPMPTIKPTVKPTAQTFPKEGKVLSQNVIVRDAPSTKGKVLGKLQKSDKVMVQALSGQFAQIFLNTDTKGYISMDYLSLTLNPALSATTTKAVSIYARMSTKNKPVATYKKGQKITLIARNGLWWKVTYSGKQGYILAKQMILPST